MRRMLGIGLWLALASPVLAQGEDRATLADRARITPAQAERAALKTWTGRVHEIELKARHGTPLYQVKFTDGSRVWVDAVTGAVVRRDPPRRLDE